MCTHVQPHNTIQAYFRNDRKGLWRKWNGQDVVKDLGWRGGDVVVGDKEQAPADDDSGLLEEHTQKV